MPGTDSEAKPPTAPAGATVAAATKAPTPGTLMPAGAPEAATPPAPAKAPTAGTPDAPAKAPQAGTPDPHAKAPAARTPAAPAMRPVPAPPAWWERHRPPLTGHAPRPVVSGVLATALVGGVWLVFNRTGLGWLLVAVALAGTAIATGRHRRATIDPEPVSSRLERAGWGTAALLLTGVGTVRDSGWLFFWCLCAALACGSVALVGGRTLAGLAAGGCALLLAPPMAVPWFGRGVARLRGASGGARVGRTLLVSICLVTVFGVLFTTADPAFARLLGDAVPSVDGGETVRAVLAVLVCGSLAAGVASLARGRRFFDDVPPLPARPVRRVEWMVPLVALDLLFLAFVLVQMETLFGGDRLVQRTTDLTYAQYARAGFWQLLIIAGLTLVVLGVAAHLAPRATALDRTLLRLLLGGLAALALVIVASALQRINTYENAYGYTRERLLVSVVEAWLGAVFLLVILAGIRLRAGFLPRTAAAVAVSALLATAVVNPDGFIAAHDVQRYHRTGRIDVAYLSGLSADALPALACLPPELRGEATGPIVARLDATGDDWRTWNLSRRRARSASNC